ncbi:unnamed protein product [[Candida] boidinii]|nr:unnamed protein product [[Candida] boidinii]
MSWANQISSNNPEVSSSPVTTASALTGVQQDQVVNGNLQPQQQQQNYTMDEVLKLYQSIAGNNTNNESVSSPSFSKDELLSALKNNFDPNSTQNSNLNSISNSNGNTTTTTTNSNNVARNEVLEKLHQLSLTRHKNASDKDELNGLGKTSSNSNWEGESNPVSVASHFNDILKTEGTNIDSANGVAGVSSSDKTTATATAAGAASYPFEFIKSKFKYFFTIFK